MAEEPVTIRPSIDREWLEAAAADDPIAHAYAVWDLERYPDRVRFFSAYRGNRVTGYLLVWPGRLAVIVHWFGARDEAAELAQRLPPRPLVVIAPEASQADVEETRGPTRGYPVLLLAAPRGAAEPGPPGPAPTRRLGSDDRAAVAALTERNPEVVAAGYSDLDLGRETVWGVFDGARLAGVARAAVALPRAWILSGVFVHPELRGRGFGRALVRAALDEARRAGVPVGLYVREDRPAARAVYAAAGFRPHGRRIWCDAGAGLAP
jgi:GNAT superfamily N-acetyltransferase